jgi:hypothetical protein
MSPSLLLLPVTTTIFAAAFLRAVTCLDMQQRMELSLLVTCYAPHAKVQKALRSASSQVTAPAKMTFFRENARIMRKVHKGCGPKWLKRRPRRSINQGLVRSTPEADISALATHVSNGPESDSYRSGPTWRHALLRHRREPDYYWSAT